MAEHKNIKMIIQKIHKNYRTHILHFYVKVIPSHFVYKKPSWIKLKTQKIMFYISTQRVLALQPSNITKEIKNPNTQNMRVFFLHPEYLTRISNSFVHSRTCAHTYIHTHTHTYIHLVCDKKCQYTSLNSKYSWTCPLSSYYCFILYWGKNNK